jgi:hypothetical protein
MVGRRQVCSPLLELLSSLFSKPVPEVPSPSSLQGTPISKQQSRNVTSNSSNSAIKRYQNQDILKLNYEDLKFDDEDTHWWPVIEMAAQVIHLVFITILYTLTNLTIRWHQECGDY